jgi:hypothetical protein
MVKGRGLGVYGGGSSRNEACQQPQRSPAFLKLRCHCPIRDGSMTAVGSLFGGAHSVPGGKVEVILSWDNTSG